MDDLELAVPVSGIHDPQGDWRWELLHAGSAPYPARRYSGSQLLIVGRWSHTSHVERVQRATYEGRRASVTDAWPGLPAAEDAVS